MLGEISKTSEPPATLNGHASTNRFAYQTTFTPEPKSPMKTNYSTYSRQDDCHFGHSDDTARHRSNLKKNKCICAPKSLQLYHSALKIRLPTPPHIGNASDGGGWLSLSLVHSPGGYPGRPLWRLSSPCKGAQAAAPPRQPSGHSRQYGRARPLSYKQQQQLLP